MVWSTPIVGSMTWKHIPKLNLSQGLEWTIEWYKKYEQNESIREITDLQIEKFQKLLE